MEDNQVFLQIAVRICGEYCVRLLTREEYNALYHSKKDFVYLCSFFTDEYCTDMSVVHHSTPPPGTEYPSPCYDVDVYDNLEVSEIPDDVLKKALAESEK